MSESLVVPSEPRPKRSWLPLIAIVAVALIAACVLAGVALGNAVSGPLRGAVSPSDDRPGPVDLANGEMTALYAHLQADDRVTGAEVNFEWYQSMDNGNGSNVFLTVDLSTPLACIAGAADPCERLVDDVARMVIIHYRKADRLSGLTVSITQHTNLGIVDFSNTPISKSLTIDEWRGQLGIEAQQ